MSEAFYVVALFILAAGLGERMAHHFVSWDTNEAVARLFLVVLPLSIAIGTTIPDSIAACLGYATGFWKSRHP